MYVYHEHMNDDTDDDDDVCAGYLPTHTLTEDYALGMEMRRKGWRVMYVND